MFRNNSAATAVASSSFVIGQFHALGIKARTLVVEVEKIPRHQGNAEPKIMFLPVPLRRPSTFGQK
jgi:hypothetical protein